MARLPRLSLPGVAHLVLQRGHNAESIVRDQQDVDHLLKVLREEALTNKLRLHGYSISGSLIGLLVTPTSAEGLSRMMQGLGRRYAAAFNRRHGRRGALWEGRFRSALVGPGEHLLTALRWIDGNLPAATASPTGTPAAQDPLGARPSAGDLLQRSSLAHRCAGQRDPALVDPPEYWQLGNTPFERESRYRGLLAEQPAATVQRELRAALQGGWACGSPSFLAQLSQGTARPLTPRPRGRPPSKAQ